jgi:hemolysin activation/secretion protein
MFITTGKTFAADITPTMPSNVGNFDSGVIDQANIRQFKEYEMKAREERSKEHRGNEQIEMKKEMQQEVDKLPNKEVTFKLNSIKFEGYTAFTEEELMNLICEKIGEQVTVADVIGMANMVTDFYQQRGYISTIAYLPPQKVQDGNIHIMIMEGKYGDIKITGNKWSKDRYLKNAYLTDKYIEEGKLLNVRDIQESLREINATGYMKGQVALTDNEESAEFTNLELNIADRFPIDFDFRWDDMGTTSTGLNRAIFFAGMYNVTGHGDQLYSTTTLAKNSIAQGVFYSVPIAKTKEAKLNLGYTYSGSEVGGELDFLDIESKSHNFFASVSRRLVKTDNYKLYGDIGVDIRNTKTEFGLIPELNYKYRSRNIKANLTNIKDDFYGKTFVNLGTGVGIPGMGGTDNFFGASKHDKSVPNNNAVRVFANAARLQALPLRSTGILQVGGQWANRALLPSEKMSVGGMTSVRGYEESAFMSDYGMTASAEVRFPVPFLRMMLPEKLHFVDDSIRLAGFYDLGWYGNVKSGDGSDMVMSVGGGVILKLTKYLSGNVYIGVPIGNKPEDASGCRVHFILSSNIL